MYSQFQNKSYLGFCSTEEDQIHIGIRTSEVTQKNMGAQKYVCFDFILLLIQIPIF